MRDFHRWSAFALIIAIFPSSASTMKCTWDITTVGKHSTPDPFYIPSADRLDWFSANNCTSIYGDIKISNHFTGVFAIPNVTLINGTITLVDRTAVSRPNLMSIELPDVLYLGGIILPHLVSLQNVSVPKAKIVGSINLTQPSWSSSWDFRSLKEATSISLTGNYSSLHFDSLERVHGKLSVCSVDNCAWNEDIPLALSFPALKSATRIQLGGAITSLSLPVLETVDAQELNDTGPSGLYLHNYGAPLALDFPNLYSVDDVLDLRGSISSLSLGSLLSSRANIIINTSSPLDANFSSLQRANTIELDGSISSADFPSLRDARQVTIDADHPIDCGPFKQVLQRAAPASNSTCNGERLPSRNGLSSGAKAGIAVGVSIAGIIIVALLVLFERRMANNYKARAGFVWRRPIPSQERRRDDPPPPYSLHPPDH